MTCNFCLQDRALDHLCNNTYTVRRRLLRESATGARATPETRQAYVDTIVREIRHSQAHHGWLPLTNRQMRERADNVRRSVTQVQIMGGEVKPEWL